jgi:hypothetical protein
MTDNKAVIEAAQQQFATGLEQQLARVDRLNATEERNHFSKASPIKIRTLRGTASGRTLLPIPNGFWSTSCNLII